MFSWYLSKAERGVSGIASFEATRVGQFMRLNPLYFFGVKVEENPQGFLDEIKNMFKIT